MRVVGKVFLSLAILLVFAVLVLGYLGFVPWVSGLFGSDKPRDLGVHPTTLDLYTAQGKFQGVEFNVPPDASAAKAASVKPVAVSTTLTSAEFTSMLQTGHFEKWPIANAQVRINPDGTAEASGLLLVDKVSAFGKRAGLSSEDVKKAMDTLHISSDVPFYIKGTGSIVNNKVSIDVQDAEIGRLPIPDSLVSSYKGEYNSFVQRGIGRMKAVSINTLKAENGQIKFDGTMPDYSPHW